jgi:hypothetical protein
MTPQAYLIKLVDGHDNLTHAQTSGEKNMFSRLASSLKTSFELTSRSINDQQGTVGLRGT